MLNCLYLLWLAMAVMGEKMQPSAFKLHVALYVSRTSITLRYIVLLC